mgnify:CR=1 FL=1
MLEPFKTADEVIDALGGTSKAAKKLGCSLQVITNWRARRIPPEMFLVVTDILNEMGRTAEPTVFGMKQAESADAGAHA